MNKIKVTTITPCHNSSKYLDECWESLKNQTIGIENMQILFVDDASEDGGLTVSMLEKYEREFPQQVTVIKLSENMRQGGARNAALQYAKGKYIQLLDSDDALAPEALETLYNLAEEHQTDLIRHHPVVHNGEKLIHIQNIEQRKAFLAYGYGSAGCLGLFYKRALLEQTGVQFAERLIYEEPLFTYPLFFYADRILFRDAHFYRYRIHDTQTMATTAKTRILDHAKVQLRLLEFLTEKKGLLDTYYDEIEEYFIWTFFYETMVNILQVGTDAVSSDDLLWLRNVCRTVFPNWRENKYIRNYPADRWKILSLLVE